MSNILENGSVLPFGLLSGSSTQMSDAFKKTYQNTSLRVGIVINSYAIDDDDNINKVFPEYDVMTFEQNEDQGSTTITYKHCLASASFGSIADFFETTLRKLEKKTTKGVTPEPSGQNGAIVLLLCLNGMSDTGIIVGSLNHPDRPTTLVDEGPHLEGEFNGVRITVNADGSTSLVFRGATDNDGKVIDDSQGVTTFQIKQDGSFEFNHDSIDILADRGGVLTITTKGNCNIQAQGDLVATCDNATVTASGDATITASGKAVVEAPEVDLGKNASEAVIKGDSFKRYFSTHTHPTVVGPSGPPTQPFTPDLLSKKVKTE